MSLVRYLAVAMTGAALFAFAPAISAQIVPVPGTGCAGPPPLFVAGGPPKPGAVLTVRCPPPPCCSPGAPSAVFIGSCVLPPITLPPGLGCAPGPCVLGCLPFAVVPGPGLPSLGPLPPAVGLTFCLQCACVSVDPTGAVCVCLSEKVNVRIVPAAC